MPDLDRLRMVELLGRLGAESDPQVLEAARELDRMIRISGTTWDDVVRRDVRTATDADTRAEDGANISAPAPETVTAADMAEAAALIDRLLAGESLSATTSEDLADMRRSIAAGIFDAMDHRYVHALARRLGV